MPKFNNEKGPVVTFFNNLSKNDYRSNFSGVTQNPTNFIISLKNLINEAKIGNSNTALTSFNAHSNQSAIPSDLTNHQLMVTSAISKKVIISDYCIEEKEKDEPESEGN